MEISPQSIAHDRHAHTVDSAPQLPNLFFGKKLRFIDKDAEVARLTKSIEKLGKELERVQNKLGNPGFVDKAPEAVIEKEKEKAAGFERDIAKLNDQIEKIR